MIIGIDASRANRKYKTGTEWYSYNLIRELARQDGSNQYVLYSDTPLAGGLADMTSGDSENKTDAKFDEAGFQILKSPHGNFKGRVLRWPFRYFWTQGRMSLEMIFKRPDVLFIPAHALPLIHPKKSIVTIHDVGYEREETLYEPEQIGPRGEKNKKILNLLVGMFTRGKYEATSRDYLGWSTEFSLKKAAKIITISYFSKKEIIEIYKTDPDKIKVIYNGFDNSLYGEISDEEKIKEVLNKYSVERPYILYTGRLEKKKNIPALVEAFALMRESNKNIKHKLVLAGKASYGFDEVNFMIRGFGLEQSVIVPGWIEEEDLPYFYNGSSLFVFPSLYEGFGIPLIEAMACGTPVAAAETSCIPEITGDAAYLFNPKNKNSISEAMAKILLDENLKNELIKKGRERAKVFSWEKCAQETLNEIISLASD